MARDNMSNSNGILSSSASKQLLPIFQMTSNRSRIQGKSQAQFIFFVNAIMEYLKTSAPPFMAIQVKLIISECVKKNQAGDPSCRPLRRAIMLSIQRCIGPTHWALADLYYKKSLRQHAMYANIKRMQTATIEERPLNFAVFATSPSLAPSACQSLAEQIAFLDVMTNMMV